MGPVFFLLYLAFLGLIFLGFGYIYLYPSIVAFRREHPSRWVIFGFNLLLGGTVIGWIAALVWASYRAQVANSPDGAWSVSLLPDEANHARREGSLDPPGRQVNVEPLTADAALQQLERLQRLRSAGHIDEPEFTALKASIIQQL